MHYWIDLLIYFKKCVFYLSVSIIVAYVFYA